MPLHTPAPLPMRAQAADRRPRNLRKLVAVSAAATVLGVGAVTTLATWNDSEWIFGGADEAGSPLGSGTFQVWQNRIPATVTSTPLGGSAEPTTGWEEQPASPGGGLRFTVDSPRLSPGTTLYAPFALQTRAGSDAGTILLQGATNTDPAAATNDDDNLLWSEARVTVRVTDTAPAAAAFCDASFAGTVLLEDQPLATAATVAQSLAADRGNVQYYCLALSLPPAGELTVGDPNTLQGRAIRPTWELQATSLS